jgi:hypothetical protein
MLSEDRNVDVVQKYRDYTLKWFEFVGATGGNRDLQASVIAQEVAYQAS